MTRKRAERLTGYEIRLLPVRPGLVGLAAFDGDVLVAQSTGRAESTALRVLVNEVYLTHSRTAMTQHNWQCARCRSRRLLQIHHRKYRSHGGTHRLDNLEPVCWDCHRIIHQTERSK
jgi:DNA-directed RNA polymerase subunit RPC12/RpoP